MESFNVIWLAVGLVLCATPPGVHGATDAFDWCYHDSSCNDTTWPVKAPKFCNGSRQSPIDIVSAGATLDADLKDFTFTKFDSKSALTKIENTGQTIKVTLDSGVGVSGGGLPTAYDSMQFHLHWGNGSSVPGSEHTVDGKRYPMEFHIVNFRSSFNGNATQAVSDSEGVAALGFFIDVSDNTTGEPAAWKSLASHLSNIKLQGQSDSVSGISLDDLLPGVNRSRFYRYLGSLTTPLCYEAVVWTVFKEPVKISKDLIDMFANTVHIGNASTPLMTNVYRNIQPAQPVTHSSGSKMNFSFGIIVFTVALWMR
ncbi:carbonic anhydrase XVb [Eucyclogobius newberryi]|uniref:carbonic anhydrase XVb n=1 Tax=Eucyclogobius newberryi TaxID=166745 RepID=UPI003B5B32B1